MRWASPATKAFVALVGLISWANGQAYFGTLDAQLAACGTDNFITLGCFQNFLGAVSTTYFRFSPVSYDAAGPQRSYPDFDPGTNYNNTVTPLGCAQVCRGFGYKYTAVRDNNCNCGMQLPASAVTGGTCNVPCAGDRNQFCGGGDDAQVYVDPTFAAVIPITPLNTALAGTYSYLGCYNIPNGFPTQDSRATSLVATIDICFQTCAGLGLPLAYGSPQLGEVQCICGTGFGYQNYRVNPPSLAQPGDCAVDCTIFGSPGGNCDPSTGARCCGQQNSYPVYISPEFQGCYSPQIPGFKTSVTQTVYECYDILASQRWPPRVLTLPSYDPALTISSTPALFHPLSVNSVAGGRVYYIYGCYGTNPITDGSIPGVFDVALSFVRLNVAPATLEGCATLCNSLNFDAFGMVNGV
ncbi:hypothetical protein B0T25DRAFT_587378 [Lasiosphaeria hispida]|uniref:WSC domain-containing protein n=1 Tax=Lasiosphaeria hispida TaxID=260671 RepID=A0AAJ0HV21_9PEZI|nr:hypothetical protein B0T25DRAFT_587378 [Lasiosphaeria hispida]